MNLQDLLYNPKNNSGYLVNKLKYEKQRSTQNKRKSLNLNHSASEDDVDFFKTCVYNNKNKAECDLLKIRLKKTVKQRSLMLNDRNLNIEANFPCMLLHHELVIGTQIEFCVFISFVYSRFYLTLK